MGNRPFTLAKFIPWRFALGICSLTALIVLVWLQRAPIAQHIANYAIQSESVSNTTFTLSRIDQRSLALDNFQTTVKLATSEIDLKASRVSTTYDFDTLRSSRIYTGNIDKLNISIRPKVVIEQQQKIDPVSIIKTLATLLTSIQSLHLPFDEFHVKQLIIDHPGFPQLSSHVFGLTINDSDKTTVIFTDTQGLSLTLLQQGTTTIAQLHSDKSDQTAIEMELSVTDHNFALQASLEPTTLVTLLKDYAILLPMAVDGGTTSLRVEIDSIQAPSEIAIGVDTEHLTIDDTHVSGLEALFHIKLDDANTNSTVVLHINNNSELRLGKLKKQDLVLEDFYLEPSGTISIDDKQQSVVLHSTDTFSLGAAQFGQLSSRNIDGNWSAQWLRNKSLNRITLLQDSQLTARTVNDSPISASNVSVKSISDNILNLLTNETPVTDHNWDLTFEQLTLDDIQVNMDRSEIRQLSIHDNTITLTTNVISPSTSSLPDHVIVDSVKTDIQLTQPSISLDGSVTLSSPNTQFGITYQGDLNDKTGAARTTTPALLDHNDIQRVIQSMPALVQQDIRVEQGSVRLSARMSHRPDKPAIVDANLSMTELSGSAADYSYQNLSIEAVIGSITSDKMNGSAVVKAEQIDYVIPMHNLTTEISLQPGVSRELPIIGIDSFTTEIFDGTLQLQPFHYDLNERQSDFFIDLTNIQMQAIVDLQNIEGLIAEGKVNARMPISIVGDKISIQDGEIWNPDSGGRIQYKIDPTSLGAASNVLTDVVIQALEDFEYESLTADADFDPDGQLYINFQLKGKSPKIDSNRPVHLNINTEQNIYSLIKSLGYADGLNKELDSRVQQQLSQ